MKVIGLTDELRSDAEQQCAAGFRAWFAEAENATWGSWEELKKLHPEASEAGGDETHFPLTADGTGIRAMVIFKMQLMILHCIATAPLAPRASLQRRISLPLIQTTTQATANPKL
jgi:mRNA-degrading endonuclease HigB of HigAB toxin-antitoxin module